MLTENEIKWIHNLSNEKLIEFMCEGEEKLGAVTTEEFSKIMGIKQRTVQQHIKDNKIICLPLCGKKFPCINANL